MNWWILGWWSIGFLVSVAWSQPEEDRVLHKTSDFSKKENFVADRSMPLGLTDDEIKTIQREFAKLMGLHHYKEIDPETFRALFKSVLDARNPTP
ncbi:unnamed protein product [Diabrotica balteata]|uniref:Uncharacterized protein n=1 Tax=Diabrotica balteata TaxID=107213 RepID=A0A9N9T8U6_DIABA|nr:unnamed protein product [Diabrotica balteata]